MWCASSWPASLKCSDGDRGGVPRPGHQSQADFAATKQGQLPDRKGGSLQDEGENVVGVAIAPSVANPKGGVYNIRKAQHPEEFHDKPQASKGRYAAGAILYLDVCFSRARRSSRLSDNRPPTFVSPVDFFLVLGHNNRTSLVKVGGFDKLHLSTVLRTGQRGFAYSQGADLGHLLSSSLRTGIRVSSAG